MVSDELRQQYKVAIGIECHVQLKTRTKLFAGVNNDARQAEPNTLISHICLGLPGALPVLNEAAVELATRAAFALGVAPNQTSSFDRKHYFYPDLPMGYQITQFYEPIIKNGVVNLDVDGQQQIVGIHEAHLEADAGKNTHPSGADYSLVDLNRAGTPLLEIVSRPDITSPAMARVYAQELYLLMKFADVSDCDLYQGNMRFDVNVSVSKSDQLGTRTETKNLNSFRSVERAAEFEINRQIELLEKGQTVVQETRGWDDAKQKTFSQRGKEFAHDYRYMPDPDLPPIVLADDFVASIKASMPIMPDEWRQRLNGLNLQPDSVATLLTAEVDNPEISYLRLLEQTLTDKKTATQLANWFINIEIPLRTAADQPLLLKDAERAELYFALLQMQSQNKISSTNIKSLIAELMRFEQLPESIEEFAAEKGLLQVSDHTKLDKIVSEVLAANSKAVQDVANGELKAIGFLVGQVMKQSKGQANPGLVQELIKKQLEL